MTRFLCVGDLHLGAGAAYGREPGDRLRDQAQVWRQALALAAEHDVDAVLFAGDAFHYRRPSPAELLAFQKPLQQFAEHDIEVVAIPGNHDVENADIPSALEVFGRDLILYSTPGVYAAPGGTAVCCLPWAPLSRLVAVRPGGDRDGLNDEAAELLIQTARGLRERVEGPAVLLTHWSISGASTPTGVATDDFREVVLPASELVALGFDAIVAGHIHKPQTLSPFTDLAFYVGSPCPVDFGEAESFHGCYLLDIGEGAPRTEFLSIKSRPFITIDYDAADLVDVSDLDPNYITDAVVRVCYTASEEQARRIDQGAIRKALYAAGAHKVYAIQVDVVREQRARVDGVTEELAPLAAVDAWVCANEIATEPSAALVELTAGYLEAV